MSITIATKQDPTAIEGRLILTSPLHFIVISPEYKKNGAINVNLQYHNGLLIVSNTYHRMSEFHIENPLLQE